MEKKKECPACAMEIDKESTQCPICGYEFSQTKFGYQWIAILLILLILLFLIF